MIGSLAGADVLDDDRPERRREAVGSGLGAEVRDGGEHGFGGGDARAPAGLFDGLNEHQAQADRAPLDEQARRRGEPIGRQVFRPAIAPGEHAVRARGARRDVHGGGDGERVGRAADFLQPVEERRKTVAIEGRLGDERFFTRDARGEQFDLTGEIPETSSNFTFEPRGGGLIAQPEARRLEGEADPRERDRECQRGCNKTSRGGRQGSSDRRRIGLRIPKARMLYCGLGPFRRHFST